MTSTAPRRKYFSETELTTGKAVYRAALALFGHGTVRFMFANMINLYENSRGFFISASLNKKDLANNFIHVNFISPLALSRDASKAPTAASEIKGLTNDKGLRQHLGLFTGNAYSYLPVWDFALNNKIPDTGNNRFLFPIGPTIYTDRAAKGSTIRTFNRDIINQGVTKFKTFENSYRVPTRRFLESQNNLFKIISEKITKKYIDGNYLGDIAKSTRFANTLLTATYRGLTAYSTKQTLRGQFESQVISGNFYKLTYYGIKNPITGQDVVIPISFNDVRGHDISIWGSKHASQDVGWDYNSYSRSADEMRSTQVKESIDQITKELTKTGKTKFRILHILNSQKNNLGYQYLLKDTTLTKNADHVRDRVKDLVIDLDKNEDTRDKLAYILDVISGSSISGGDFLSLILDFDDSSIIIDDLSRVIDVDNAIGMLSSRGFQSITHLHSESPKTNDDKIIYSTLGYRNYGLKISISPSAIDISSINLKWDRIWEIYSYYPVREYSARLDAHILKLNL